MCRFHRELVAVFLFDDTPRVRPNRRALQDSTCCCMLLPMTNPGLKNRVPIQWRQTGSATVGRVCCSVLRSSTRSLQTKTYSDLTSVNLMKILSCDEDENLSPRRDSLQEGRWWCGPHTSTYYTKHVVGFNPRHQGCDSQRSVLWVVTT